jgi:NAD(P)-dependent dehydrogenase (short-subunit alcohol dehydrogenase family)
MAVDTDKPQEFPGRWRLDGRVALVTGASSYMTGQALVIDGGWTAV